MKKFLLFFLLLSAVMLSANSCATSPAINYNVPQSANPSPMPQRPEIPTPTPTPVNPAPVPTTQPAGNTPVVTPPPAPAPVPTPTPKSTVETIQINIQNFSFSPAEATITVGSTVVWTNNDSAPHQIASNSFNSSPLSQGGTFSQKFATAGTYDYHCAIHPSMTGRIIVK
jgi:plastocyanin